MTFGQTVKRFFEPALYLKGATFRAIVWQIIVYIQGPINAFFIGVIISGLEQKDIKAIYSDILIYIVIMLLIHLSLEFTKRWGRPETFYQQIRFIQDKYLENYIQLDGNYLEKMGTGKLIAIMYNGFEKWTSLIVDCLGYGIGFIIAFISGFYFSSVLGWKFIIGYILLFFFILKISIYLDNPSKELRNKRRDSINDYSRALTRFIMSRVDIIQNNTIRDEVNRTGFYLDSAARYTLAQATPLSRMFNIPRLIINIFRILLIISGIALYNQNKITLGEFTSMLGFMLIIDEVMTKFIQAYKNITKDINSVEKLREIFDKSPQSKNLYQGNAFSLHMGNMIISNILFSYENNNPIFNNFSLELKGGTKTAFVGESGGGKTTLIKLLAGYLRPDSGDIIIDGQKLSEVKLTDYYRHIGYLTQEPSVFDGTIYENLTYALDDEKMDLDKKNLEKKIHEIIKLAKCEFIYEFEHGLQTEIGERGVRLSGGQKQRLAIAKIMLKNPNIILLDEPTSALDSFNEELVSEALNNLFKGKTVIVVAHRLQTVKNADRILYIEGGKVIEDGTHTSLIKKNGKYKKMLDLQSGF